MEKNNIFNNEATGASVLVQQRCRDRLYHNPPVGPPHKAQAAWWP